MEDISVEEETIPVDEYSTGITIPVEEEPPTEPSGWGLPSGLSDWVGLGVAAVAAEYNNGDADEGFAGGDVSAVEKSDAGASDAELEALTKGMESGLTAWTAPFGLGLGSAADSTTPDGDALIGDTALPVNTDMSALAEGLESGLTSAVEGMESGFTSALNGFGFGISTAEDGESTAKEGTDDNNDTPVSSSIWSALGSVAGTVSSPRLNYHPIGGGIGEWIDDLQKEQFEKDPHTKLRESLDAFLEEHPRAAYEDWVEHFLEVSEGWDEGSAVVDDTFYLEKSNHRIVWNERNIEDGIGADEGETKRKYVPVIDLSAGEGEHRR